MYKMNEDGPNPNWRALSTIHLKRFIKASQISNESGSAEKKIYQLHGLDGNATKKFYDELVSDQNTVSKKLIYKCNYPKISVKKMCNIVPFERKKFFFCAQTNDSTSLKNFEFNNDNINSRDEFGWTALMVAACEGALSSVKTLLDLGIEKDLKNKSGQTALMLSKIKGHIEIAHVLNAFGKSNTSLESNLHVVPNLESFYCDLCQQRFEETTFAAHQTSTVHQFNLKSSVPRNKLQRFNISQKNRGLQIMIKQGWDRERGLGPSQSGILYPLKTVLRKHRTGLGIKQDAARITHFKPFDEQAVKRNNSEFYKKKITNGNDMRREKVREWKRDRRLRRELS